MTLLDGIAASNALKTKISEEVAQMVLSGHRPPKLAAILAGNDGASLSYVGNKVKMCEAVGFESLLISLPSEVSEEELLRNVKLLNEDQSVDGFIVQLPLPAQINSQRVIESINPNKDADGFHPENYGRMALNLSANIPATPFGILKLLEHFSVPTEGRNCVIIGRSQIVGSPMSILLSRNTYPGNCTVTLAHSRTQDLSALCRSADIIIAALGKPEFLTSEMVKDGVVVIDVGITRVTDASKKSGFRLVGDVHFESVAPKCSFITPVPGGVGPMTVTALMLNTLQAALRNR